MAQADELRKSASNGRGAGLLAMISKGFTPNGESSVRGCGGLPIGRSSRIPVSPAMGLRFLNHEISQGTDNRVRSVAAMPAEIDKIQNISKTLQKVHFGPRMPHGILAPLRGTERSPGTSSGPVGTAISEAPTLFIFTKSFSDWRDGRSFSRGAFYARFNLAAPSNGVPVQGTKTAICLAGSCNDCRAALPQSTAFPGR